MPPTTTLATLRQRVIKRLYKPRYPTFSTTTALGTTTKLTDKVLTAAGKDTDFINAWVYIVETVAGGPAIREVSRVTNTDFSGSLSDLTPLSPAFSAAVQTGTDYELHFHFHPSHVEDTINDILENLESDYLIPLTLVQDGDFEDAAQGADWTNNGATATKDTTTVLHGRRSLKVTATAASGQARSDVINIPPSTSVLVATDCFITSGDSASLILMSGATSASLTQLEIAKSDDTGWVRLQFVITTGATDEVVQVRLQADADTDVIYFDNCILLQTQGAQIVPPSEVEVAGDMVGSLFYYPRGAAISGGTFSYKIQNPITHWSHYSVERDDTAVVPLRLEVERVPIREPLFLAVAVDYATLASETATTLAPRDLVVELAYADLLDDLSDEAEEENNLDLALKLRVRAAKARRDVMGDYLEFRPQRTKIQGAGKPVRTTRRAW